MQDETREKNIDFFSGFIWIFVQFSHKKDDEEHREEIHLLQRNNKCQ